MQFIQKPLVVDAIQWTGLNLEEVTRFMQGKSGLVQRHPTTPAEDSITLITLGGIRQEARIGDWIVKGRRGELYPVTQTIFDEVYEIVRPPEPPKPVVNPMSVLISATPPRKV